MELIKSKLDVDVTEKDLDRSHRATAKKPSDGPWPIIVKFARHNVRQKVYAVRTKLKGTQIFIREDLTVKKQKLMRETLKHESIAKAWSTDGRIRALTRKNKVVTITQGDRCNVSRPLARIHSTNQHAQKHLLRKSGYKEAYGWKVINPNRVLQVNSNI